MHPVQIAVLAALIVYAGYRIRRDLQAEREFFRALVEQLSRVLLPKGRRITWSADLSKSIGHRIATYEGPTFCLEVFFDIVDREVFLRERGTGVPGTAWHTIASAGLPRFAKSELLRTAAAAIVNAAIGVDDTAYLTPARFEVRDVYEITGHGRVVSGTILAGSFRVGRRVWAEHKSVSFRISDVGFLDDIAKQSALISFVLEDAPPLTELRQVLSSGSILTDTEPVAEAS